MLFSEPKIPQCRRNDARDERDVAFQCSSASRKFLNFEPDEAVRSRVAVSVLFSEPKIPQSNSANGWRRAWRVSVLFSEPKIPQFRVEQPADDHPLMFQCSSASRKFLNGSVTTVSSLLFLVSVLFSEPKIPQSSAPSPRRAGTLRFSALQRAENSSI